MTCLIEFICYSKYTYVFFNDTHNKSLYRTRATINHGYFYFFRKSYVGFSLMIPLKMCGYKTRAVIKQARLKTARVQYSNSF